MKRHVLLCIAVSLCAMASAQKTCELASPDGCLRLKIEAGELLTYSLTDGDALLLDNSVLGLTLEGEGDLCTNPVIKKQRTDKGNETIVAPFYRQQQFTTAWNALTLTLKNGLQVEFRAYNEGIAYRYILTSDRPVNIADETATFRVADDWTAYLPYSTNPQKPEAMAFQATYDVAPISQQPSDNLAFLPVTIDAGKAKLTIMETAVEDYPGMFIVPAANALDARFPRVPKAFDFYPWRQQKYVVQTEDFIAHVTGARSLPWRIVAVSRDDSQMPVNNLVYALAEPSRIADTSWIRPGLVSWDWWNNWGLTGVDFEAGINDATYKYYIDFAARYRLPYVILDEGWYKPSSGDMLTTIDDIHLPLLVAYARERGVQLILWTVFNVLDAQLETACQLYADMGIAGFKVDFVDRDDQEAQQMIWRIAAACAQHRLVLDYHGIAKPAGIQRTWPNVLNFESCFGMEEVKWTPHGQKDMPAYDVTFPFIRMQAGYVDFTPGGMRNATQEDFQPIYKNPLTMGTRCHQLAMYIVYDSPLTMLADSPTAYEKEPSYTAFIASLPTVFDATLIPKAQLGEYIVTARRRGDAWYVAGQTNWQERDIELPLTFLGDGSYTATLFTDGANANQNACDYRAQELTLSACDTLTVHLAQGGGFAMKLLK